MAKGGITLNYMSRYCINDHLADKELNDLNFHCWGVK